MSNFTFQLQSKLPYHLFVSNFKISSFPLFCYSLILSSSFSLFSLHSLHFPLSLDFTFFLLNFILPLKKLKRKKKHTHSSCSYSSWSIYYSIFVISIQLVSSHFPHTHLRCDSTFKILLYEKLKSSLLPLFFLYLHVFDFCCYSYSCVIVVTFYSNNGWRMFCFGFYFS